MAQTQPRKDKMVRPGKQPRPPITKELAESAPKKG